MAESKRETAHNPKDDHGTDVQPHRIIPPGAGHLVCPDNKGKYAGDNAAWRR